MGLRGLSEQVAMPGARMRWRKSSARVLMTCSLPRSGSSVVCCRHRSRMALVRSHGGRWCVKRMTTILCSCGARRGDMRMCCMMTKCCGCLRPCPLVGRPSRCWRLGVASESVSLESRRILASRSRTRTAIRWRRKHGRISGIRSFSRLF